MLDFELYLKFVLDLALVDFVLDLAKQLFTQTPDILKICKRIKELTDR